MLAIVLSMLIGSFAVSLFDDKKRFEVIAVTLIILTCINVFLSLCVSAFNTEKIKVQEFPCKISNIKTVIDERDNLSYVILNKNETYSVEEKKIKFIFGSTKYDKNTIVQFKDRVKPSIQKLDDRELLYLFNLDSYEYEVHLVEKNNGKIK